MDVIMDVADGPGVRARQHCHGAWGAGNNWAKGHFTEDADVDIIQHKKKSSGRDSGMDTMLRLAIRRAEDETEPNATIVSIIISLHVGQAGIVGNACWELY